MKYQPQTQVKFLAEDYHNYSTSIDSLIKRPIVYLNYKYEFLEDVTITDRETPIWEIFQKVKDNVKLNYVPSSIPMKYLHIGSVAHTTDTLSKMIFPVVLWRENSNQVFNYRNYYFDYNKSNGPLDTLDTGHLLIRTDNFEYELIPFKRKSFDKSIDLSYYKNAEKKYQILRSVYEKGNEQILDIIMIDKTFHKPLKNNLLSIGMNKIPNIETLKQLKTLSVFNYHINLNNYALESSRMFMLSVDDIIIEKIFNIKNRQTFTDILSISQQLQRPFQFNIHNFNRTPEYNNKYFLEYFGYSDHILFYTHDSTNNQYPINQYWHHIGTASPDEIKTNYTNTFTSYNYIYGDILRMFRMKKLLEKKQSTK